MPSDKPHFIYVLTIAQHGPHATSDTRKDYMQRLRHSAEDLQDLKRSLQRDSAEPGGRPWVMSWFGDHRVSIDMEGPDRWMTWGVVTSISASPVSQRSAKVQTEAMDIAHLNRLLQRELHVGWHPFSQLQDRALMECRADFHACSAEHKDQLVRAYIDMGGFTSWPVVPAITTVDQAGRDDTDKTPSY